jgi:hypothetical protein
MKGHDSLVPESRPPGRFSRILRFAGTLAALALLLFLLSQQGWDQVLAAAQLIPPFYFVLAILLMLGSRLAVVVRWHVLLRAAGIPIALKQSFRITFAGLFASNFLPTTIGGDLLRVGMAMQLGYDRVICAASVVVDRLVGMAGMISAIPLSTGLVLDALDISRLSTGQPALAITAGLWARGRRIINRLLTALQLWLKQPAGLAGAFGLTWIHQVGLFTTVWLLLQGTGQTLDWFQVAGLWSLTYMVTLIPISINGLGLQELSMTVIFSQVGGVDLESAAAAALLVRTIQLIASLPGVAFVSDILRQRRA